MRAVNAGDGEPPIAHWSIVARMHAWSAGPQTTNMCGAGGSARLRVERVWRVLTLHVCGCYASGCPCLLGCGLLGVCARVCAAAIHST